MRLWNVSRHEVDFGKRRWCQEYRYSDTNKHGLNTSLISRGHGYFQCSIGEGYKRSHVGGLLYT